MYGLQPGRRPSNRLATQEASLRSSSSQEAQHVIGNHVNLFRFNNHRTRLLQTILACCISLAWSSCSGIVLNKAAPSLSSTSVDEQSSMTSASPTIEATVNARRRVATLSTLSCSNASMTGSVTDACTVTLSGAAPSGGLSVSLSSSSGAVTVPTTVTVPANATSSGFK